MIWPVEVLSSSWVLPYWLERQGDPTSPDFVPGAPGEGDVPANRTHRDATMIGNLATWERAAVDPVGLVSLHNRSWSLDWWVGAEDRWHLPGRSRAVRQRLVDGTPVVETAMRVPGGELLHRAFAFHDTTVGPCVGIEVENRSAVPVAVALSIRPFDIVSAGAVDEIELAGDTVLVDGRVALLLPRAPAGWATGDALRGDCASVVLAGAAEAPAPADAANRVVDPGHLASAAVVLPLTHTAVLRAVLPLASDGAAARPASARTSGRARRRASDGPRAGYPSVVPTAAHVARGWAAQTRRGLQVELPDTRLATAVGAARAHLLLAHGGEDLVAWSRPLDWTDAAVVLGALDRWGFPDEVDQVLGSVGERQRLDGAVDDPAPGVVPTAAMLAAVAEHCRIVGDAELADRLVGPLAKAAHWLARSGGARGRGGADRGTSSRGGRRRAGAAADDDPVQRLLDAAWSVRGLGALASALRDAGQPEVAQDVDRFAAEWVEALDGALDALAAEATGADPSIRPSPAWAGRLELLDALAPDGVLDVRDPRVERLVTAVRATAVDGALFWREGRLGLAPGPTMALAAAEVAGGDAAALDRLAWAVGTAGPTTAWAEAIHPTTGHGSAGRPHDPVATARFLLLVRHLLVHEPGGPGLDQAGATGAARELALLAVVPEGWLGQPVDVRGAPTGCGTLSYSIRWHGDRPALLWELEPSAGVTSVRVTAPGLDPGWSSTELRGEALLAPVAVPQGAAVPSAGDAHVHAHAELDTAGPTTSEPTGPGAVTAGAPEADAGSGAGSLGPAHAGDSFS
jgi:hypothetical protein